MLRSLLRRHPLGAYFTYRALAMTWAFAPFQVYYLQHRGLSVASIFDLNVVFCLAAVAFEVPTGVFADRHGRRLAMSAAGFVMTAACALFVLGRGFGVYAMANVLCALAMTLSSGADSAWLFDHLEAGRQSSRYPRLEGWSTAAKGLGNLGAVLLGAVLYQYVHPGAVFVFTGLITGTAGLVALELPERKGAREGFARDHLARAFTLVGNDSRILTVVAFGALSFVLLRLSLFADQPHLEAHLTNGWLQRTVLTMGLLAAAKEVATAAVAGAAGWLFVRARARLLAAALGASLVVAYALMGEGGGALCVTLMVALAGAFGVFSPLMRALLNRLIQGPRDRATILSIEGMARRLLFAAASPVFGRAVEASSLHATFAGTAYVAGLCYALLGFFALVAFRAVTLPSRPPGPDALASLAR